MRRFREVYGERPAHLVVLVGCLAVAGYAASFLLGDPALPRLLVWFGAAALGHDLVLVPLYSALDRALVGSTRRWALAGVPLVNHVRVPLLGAGLALLMFLPGIIRQGEPAHLAATGLDQAPYLGRWLGLAVALALASALVLLLRVAVARRRARGARRGVSR